jgi:hypothetical protein
MIPSPYDTTDNKLLRSEIRESLSVLKAIVFRNWTWFLSLPAAGFALGYWIDRYLDQVPIYEATVVFNLTGSNQASGKNANKFGWRSKFDPSIYDGRNLLYFAKSRPVLEQTLLSRVEVEGKQEILANLFLDSCMVESWRQEPAMDQFRFVRSGPEPSAGTRRRVLNKLIAETAESTEIEFIGRKSSFISITAQLPNEFVASLWLNTLISTIEKLYAGKKTEKMTAELLMLQQRADSAGKALSETELDMTRKIGHNLQVFRPEAKAAASIKAREVSYLRELYAEALTDVDNMQISLIESTPMFTIIEDVKVPLETIHVNHSYSKLRALTGLVIAALLAYLKTRFAPGQEHSGHLIV